MLTTVLCVRVSAAYIRFFLSFFLSSSVPMFLIQLIYYHKPVRIQSIFICRSWICFLLCAIFSVWFVPHKEAPRPQGDPLQAKFVPFDFGAAGQLFAFERVGPPCVRNTGATHMTIAHMTNVQNKCVFFPLLWLGCLARLYFCFAVVMKTMND